MTFALFFFIFYSMLLDANNYGASVLIVEISLTNTQPNLIVGLEQNYPLSSETKFWLTVISQIYPTSGIFLVNDW